MLDSLEIKNIPVSISILHEQEYHNLCKMLYRVNKQRRRRAFTDVRTQLHSMVNIVPSVNAGPLVKPLL
jgi:hypothetical protein